MKREKCMIWLVLLILLFVGLTGCTNNNDELQEVSRNMPTTQTFKATEKNVKVIGRTHTYNDALWIALSGGGVEFSFTGTKAEITIKGDNVAVSTNNDTNYARIGIYVNGKRVIDDVLKEAVKTYPVFESETAQDVVVRVVKLSESAMSTVGIQEISVDSTDGIKPTPEKVHKIEFIGDSITCGYGVDDEAADHHFSTATEDVTKAYAYKTAQELQAEYSMVAYSGYGIISGYSGNGEKVTSQLVPTYYDKVGMSYGDFDGTLNVESVLWDFQKYKPDLIVINLGTNDDSYSQDNGERQEEFAKEYATFLKKVRSYNPQAKILCTLGIMGDRLFPRVEQAVADYTKETGDTNVATMKFNLQLSSDGFAADWHPSEATHNKAADKLTGEIKRLMNW